MSSIASNLIKAGIRNAPTVAATAAVALVVSVASLFGGAINGDESEVECDEEYDDHRAGPYDRTSNNSRDHGRKRSYRSNRRYDKSGAEGGDDSYGEDRERGTYGGVNQSVRWSDEVGEDLTRVLENEEREAEEYYEQYDYDDDHDEGEDDGYKDRDLDMDSDSHGKNVGGDVRELDHGNNDQTSFDKEASGNGKGGGGIHDITPQSGGTVTPGWGFYVSITPDEHKKYASVKDA